MEENITPQLEEEEVVIENDENSSIEQSNIKENTDSDSDENATEKKSRIYGIIGIVAFVVLGGVSYCSWWMWIVVALLGLMTLAGESKKSQAFLAVVVILFGTPVIFGSDKEESATTVTTNSTSTESDNSIAGPDWIEGTWVFKGYVPGISGYCDVAVDFRRSDRRFVMVDNSLGQEIGTYSVHGNVISTSSGTSFELDNSTHKIGLGHGIYLTKK